MGGPISGAFRRSSLLRSLERVVGHPDEVDGVSLVAGPFGIKVGKFVPKTYVEQLVENSDFRKYDDGLRMILDCTRELARELTQRLATAASKGIVRYGLHEQDAAMMTCFTPSVMRSDHVHFIDGARGGYASAATVLKATA